VKIIAGNAAALPVRPKSVLARRANVPAHSIRIMGVRDYGFDRIATKHWVEMRKCEALPREMSYSGDDFRAVWHA